jgi:hypothetical protein
MYDEHRRVYSYSMAVPPRISLRVARFAVRRELPSDARLSFVAKKKPCEIVQYRSRAVARALHTSGAVNAALYSSTTDAPFNGRNVTEVILLPGLPGDRSVGC